jgi:uncharacterized protein (TIGR03084 family)
MYDAAGQRFAAGRQVTSQTARHVVADIGHPAILPGRGLRETQIVTQIFDDLEAEQDEIEAVLAPLDAAGLQQPSAAAGWSISDVVLHLAQSEESVVAAISGVPLSEPLGIQGATTDEIIENWVRAERGDPIATVERWRAARRRSLAALRGADLDARYPWIAATLRPEALATTRLAEHWAHALDIAEPLGVDYPDTDRLRHIAWLAQRTLPYAFQLSGQLPQDVRCELMAPDGTTVWNFGDETAESLISGSAGDFCRVGAQRMKAADSGLVATGQYADVALAVLRNYAG